MKLEVLMSTMNQSDFGLVEKANLNTDTIIINQTNFNKYAEKKIRGNIFRMYSYNELGVGRSRNTALLRSEADICLIADDDITYNDNYEKIILESFKDNPNVDSIIFNIDFIDKKKKYRKKNKNQVINKINFMKHGGPKIAFKREKIIEKNIYFSLLFGGGSKYGSGEDSLFIKEMLNSNLNVISVDKTIGVIDNTKRDSTWFTGFNEKYLLDKGALFLNLFPYTWLLFCLQFSIRHKKKFSKDYTRRKIFFTLIKGAREYQEN